jgi:hypothetical protein
MDHSLPKIQGMFRAPWSLAYERAVAHLANERGGLRFAAAATLVDFATKTIDYRPAVLLM